MRIPNSMVTTSLAAEENKGSTWLAGIFMVACSWLSKRRRRALLYKTSTRLSAERSLHRFSQCGILAAELALIRTSDRVNRVLA